MKQIKNNPQTNAFEILKDARVFRGDELYLALTYPENGINFIKVGLSHVRATDDIRISFDFTRDGWIIEQASIFLWDGDDEVCDPDWQEVAFVQAWAREKKVGNV